jgi:ADP-ribosylglycohydrolase
MIGAIAGDIVGSVYEHSNIKTKEFPLFGPRSTFTDDTVLTVATASALLEGRHYADPLLEFARRHPYAGYGRSFRAWLSSADNRPYNSWGNGAAMRVSPIGFAFSNRDEVLRQARLSAEVTHNHPEGVKGAQAAALSVYMARAGHDKASIKDEVTRLFGYNLDRTLDCIRPAYAFDVSCQGSVPEAIIAFLESDSYEDALRNAVSLGGDSDTIACIAGGIAEAFYGGVPPWIAEVVRETLTDDLWSTVEAFCARFRGSC